MICHESQSTALPEFKGCMENRSWKASLVSVFGSFGKTKKRLYNQQYYTIIMEEMIICDVVLATDPKRNFS